MTGWTLLAMLAAAVTLTGWTGSRASTRWAVRPPAVAAASSGRGLPWVPTTLGGVGAVLIGWLFLPSQWSPWSLAVLAAAGGVVGHHVGRRLPSSQQRADSRRRRAELPVALELLATCLTAGLPLSAAAVAVRDGMTGPLHADLGRVLHHIEIGVAEGEAWLSVAHIDVWHPICRDIARSASSGTTLVEVLQRAAADAREAHHTEQLSRARTAGVRSVLPLMVCYLPAFLVLGIVPIIGAAITRVIG